MYAIEYTLTMHETKDTIKTITLDRTSFLNTQSNSIFPKVSQIKDFTS